MQASRREALLGGLIGGLALLVGARPAGAASLDLEYTLSVEGLAVGQVAFVVTESAGTYTSQARLQPSGLALFLSADNFTYEATSIIRDGVVQPSRFVGVEDKTDRRRRVTIRYGRDGEIAEIDYRNGDRPGRIDTPEALRRGTVDPLTACHRIRAWLANGAADGASLTVPVFDGRKRYDFALRKLGDAEVNSARGSEPADELHLRIVARHGFDRNDRLVSLPGDPPEKGLRLFASQDARRIPLLIRSVGTSPATTIQLAG